MQSSTAVILAGGRSSRMGFDKQSIKLRDQLLIKHQIKALQAVFDQIVVVTNKPELYDSYDCKVVADVLKDFGPLGGIHAGLMAADSEYSYFIACDMPYINVEYVLYMLSKINNFKEQHVAVVTRYGRWLEPFNAFYSKQLLPAIMQAYANQNKRISNLLEDSKVCYIEEAEARTFSPDWSMFTNINTLEDLQKLEKSIAKE